MHGASRESLLLVEQRLSEVIDGLTGKAGSVGNNKALGKLSDESFAVVTLLSAQSGLRRALADSSTDPASREQLVTQLLGSKVSAPTLSVVVAVVTARWSSPRELVDGLELLARTTLLVQAEKNGRLDAVEDELFRLGRIVAANPTLERLLSDPTGSQDGKRELLEGLLNGKVEPVTLALVENLVANPRGRGVLEGFEELAAMAAKRRERSVAYVRSVVALTEAQEERLSATLERIYARPIALHVEVDPSIGGGLVIKVGDEVIDGSAAGRLEALRRELAG